MTQTWKAWASVLGWMSLNISLSLLNKYLFKSDFRFPILIIMVGTFSTFIGCSICVFILKINTISIEQILENWKLLLFMSICHGLSTGLENLSIVYISISLNQVIKATAPAGTIIAASIFEGKQFSKELYVSTFITVCGVVLAILKNPEFNWIGFLCAVASTVLGVSNAIASGILLQRAHIRVMIIALVTSIPAIFSLIPVFAYMEYRDISQHFRDGNITTFSLLIFMGFLGFIYNLTHYWVIDYTSAHYAALIGNMKVLLLVIISMIIFHTTLKPINYIGILISLAGFCLYNVFRYREGLQLKKAVETHEDHGSSLLNEDDTTVEMHDSHHKS